jgi:hypothetical protein
MAEEEVVDAESSTLNKNTSPLDHLKHLINIGWTEKTPLIQKFVEKYNLEDELYELIKEKSKSK